MFSLECDPHLSGGAFDAAYPYTPLMNNPETCYSPSSETITYSSGTSADYVTISCSDGWGYGTVYSQHASDNPAKKVTVPFQNTYGESWQSVENHSGIIRRIRMRKAREPPASYYKNTLNSCVGLHSN